MLHDDVSCDSIVVDAAEDPLKIRCRWVPPILDLGFCGFGGCEHLRKLRLCNILGVYFFLLVFGKLGVEKFDGFRPGSGNLVVAEAGKLYHIVQIEQHILGWLEFLD